MAQPKGTAKPTGGEKPLLNLSTFDKVDFIIIDDDPYDLVNLDVLPVHDRLKIGEEYGAALELIIKEFDKPLSKKKERDLAAMVKALTKKIVPDIPAAILDKLHDHKRREIVLSFFAVRTERMAGTTAIEAATRMLESRSTGESPSPASNGSIKRTTRSAGSRRSRRAG